MEAALAAGILCFNVESAAELDALDAVAGRTRRARAGVVPRQPRRRPEDPSRTSRPASRRASSASPSPRRRRSTAARPTLPHIAVRGIDCHIGSQITDLAAVSRGRGQGAASWSIASRRDGIALAARRPRRRPRHPLPRRGADRRCRTTRRGAARASAAGRERLLFEPGRLLVGNAGVLLDPRRVPEAGRRAQLRDRRRGDERPDPPGALRRLARGRRRCARAAARRAAGRSSDRSARAATSSPATASSRSRRATCSRCARAGAYGFAMSSNYNSRPRACEVMVDGGDVHLVRPRESESPSSSRANRDCRDRSDAPQCAARIRRARDENRVCECATVACSRVGIVEEFLQFKKMWLEFRQQVATGLSRV